MRKNQGLTTCASVRRSFFTSSGTSSGRNRRTGSSRRVRSGASIRQDDDDYSQRRSRRRRLTGLGGLFALGLVQARVYGENRPHERDLQPSLEPQEAVTLGEAIRLQVTYTNRGRETSFVKRGGAFGVKGKLQFRGPRRVRTAAPVMYFESSPRPARPSRVSSREGSTGRRWRSTARAEPCGSRSASPANTSSSSGLKAARMIDCIDRCGTARRKAHGAASRSGRQRRRLSWPGGMP